MEKIFEQLERELSKEIRDKSKCVRFEYDIVLYVDFSSN